MKNPANHDLAESQADLAGKLAALAHPARIEILRRLSVDGCCCCKDVVKSVDLAQSTISQHLKILVSAGLVRYTPDGRRSLYMINWDVTARLSEAVSALLETCCAGPSGCAGPERVGKK